MRPPARTTRSARSAETPEPVNALRCAVSVNPGSNRSSRMGTPCSDKEKKPRHRMTDKQLERLEALYLLDTHPTREEKQALGDEVGMDTRTVTVWFQNRRQLAKKQSVIVNKAPQPMCRQPLGTISHRNQPSRQPSYSSLSQVSSAVDRSTPQPPKFSRQMKRELWEHLPSTPPSQPTSAFTSAMPSPLAKKFHGSHVANDDSDKENIGRKRKPILEWACARMAKRQRLQPLEENLDICGDETEEEEEEHENTLVDFDGNPADAKLGKKPAGPKSTGITSSGSLDAIAIPPEYSAKFDADVVLGASLLLTFQYAYRA